MMRGKRQIQDQKVHDGLNGNEHSLVLSLKSRMIKIKPEKFGWDDVAQQIIGAYLFASPFAVTQEVWDLSVHLSTIRTLIIIIITVFVSSLIIYYTKFQKVAMEVEEVGPIEIPRRLLSLFIISYSASFSILWMFGVIGQITDPLWIVKLVIFVSFFSSIGAATADILK